MIKGYVRYCDRCGVELTKANNTCGFELCDKCNEALEQQLAIKNDLPHCQHTDEEIAKSFIEDVEAVKDQLPCGEQMDFPNTFDEFAKDYGFKDKDEVYTNGSELIPVFRVKQWLEHISTTKNDLGVDCISRADARHLIAESFRKNSLGMTFNKMFKTLYNGIDDLPSVTPQEPFINKPCVSSGACEHDKNEVLDKIRAEILEEHENAYAREDYDTAYGLSIALNIIDKYKSESEKA